MNCPRCNAPCRSEDRFCTGCGAELSTPEAQHEPEEIAEAGAMPLEEQTGGTRVARPARPSQQISTALLLAGVGLLLLVVLLPRLLAGPPQPEKTPQEAAQDYFTQARSEYALDNYAEALTLLESAIREDPDLQEATMLREEIIPLRVNQFLWAAKEARGKGDYATACARVQDALRLDGGCTEAAALLTELQPLAAQQSAEAQASAPVATIPPAASDTAPPAVAVDLLDTMDSAARRGINVFLSNFSEDMTFTSFDASNYQDAQLINFAFGQNYTNNADALTHDGEYCYLPEENVSNTIDRFFGLSVVPQSTDTLAYNAGEYRWPEASGVLLVRFSLADRMIKNADGTYSVQFTVYEYLDIELSVSLSELYGYAPEQIREDALFTAVEQGTAVLKDATYHGKASYHLVQYNTVALSGATSGGSAPSNEQTSIVFDSKGRFEEYGLLDEDGNAIFSCGIIIADFEFDEGDPFQVPWCRGVVYNDTGIELMGMELSLVGLDEAGREVVRDGTTLHIDVDSSEEFDFTLMWLDSKSSSVSSIVWQVVLHDYS